MNYLIAAILILSLSANVLGQTIILTSDNNADLSVAEAAAGKADAALVNATWGKTDQAAIGRVKGLAPAKVIIIGGNAAVPAEIEENLRKSGIEVIRITGQDRYETAAETASYFWKNTSQAMLVEGTDSQAIDEARRTAKDKRMPIMYMEKGKMSENSNNKLKEMRVSSIQANIAPDTDETQLRKDLYGINLTIKEADKETRAAKAIQEAEGMLRKAKEKINISSQADAGGVAAAKMLVLAEESLKLAKEAYNYSDWGVAYGHAVSSQSMSLAAININDKMKFGWYGEHIGEAEEKINAKGIEEAKKELITRSERTSECPAYVSPSPAWFKKCEEKGGKAMPRENARCKMPPMCVIEIGDDTQTPENPTTGIRPLPIQNKLQACPEQRPEACADGYEPVCAKITEEEASGVSRITHKTYPNACQACQDKRAAASMKGECIQKTEPYTPPLPGISPGNATSGVKPIAPPLQTSKCTAPRPEACAQVYEPVCAKIIEQDQTGLIKTAKRTYSNGCMACTNPNVSEYRQGACETEPTGSAAATGTALPPTIN